MTPRKPQSIESNTIVEAVRPLSPYEKSARGLPLTAADIQELLKDPNSWVSKLYAELQISQANHIAFVHHVEATMREYHQIRAEERMERLNASRENPAFATSVTQRDAMTENLALLSPRTIDKMELKIVLHSLADKALDDYTEECTSSASQQILDALKEQKELTTTFKPDSSRELDVTLRIPESIKLPEPASINKILDVNTHLANSLLPEDEKDPQAIQAAHVAQNAFAEHYNKSRIMGSMRAIDIFRQLLQENRKDFHDNYGFNVDNITPVMMMGLLRYADKLVHDIARREDNVRLMDCLTAAQQEKVHRFVRQLQQPKLNPSEEALNAAIQSIQSENPFTPAIPYPSLTKPPAMYAPRPGQSAKRLVEDDKLIQRPIPKISHRNSGSAPAA